MSDLMLLLSEKESFGLVLLEAMACGVPCIGTSVGGIPEVIEHGETGYICEVGDTEGIAKQAIQLLKNEGLHHNMAERAMEAVYEQFRSEKIVSQYEAIYYDILRDDKNERFKQASSIIEILKQHGHEAYFVGGSVRDFIIDRPIGDIDIATSALPEEVMHIFPRHVPVGLEHGTVIVVQEGVPYEVTTFRTESEYEDFRRPSSVQFVRSLEEDLKRRDFTMNAIAMTEEGEMVDLFAGQEAIRLKEITTVGDAADRFQEDALRMMRGIRFVSTLGFFLEIKTKQAIEDVWAFARTYSD